MRKEQLRSRIEALEASISQATQYVIQEQQLNQISSFDFHSVPNNQAGHLTDNISDVVSLVLGENEAKRSHEINILTRPLQSLGYFKSIVPTHLYPAFSERYGITHWAVEVAGRVFEVRTEGWKGKGGKMTIRESESRQPEYQAENVERYRIGVASKQTVKLFRKMAFNMARPEVGKYHFYNNNCQLIAAAMAIAGCEQPAAGWKTVVLRDGLIFFNKNNPGDLLRVLDDLLPEHKYYQFLKEVESDYKERKHWRKRLRRSPSMNRSVQIRVAGARDALSAVSEIAFFAAIYPIAILFLTIEKAIERYKEMQPLKPPLPDNLFGIPSQKQIRHTGAHQRSQTMSSVSSQSSQATYSSFSSYSSYRGWSEDPEDCGILHLYGCM